MPAPALVSPTSTIYSGPPPPYSYPPSATSSIVGGNNGTSAGQVPGNYNPSQNRQTTGDDKDGSYAPPRQSLPSINEALSISSILNTNAPSRPSITARSPTSPTYRHHIDTPLSRPTESIAQQSPRETKPYEVMHRTSISTYSSQPSYTSYDTKSIPSTISTSSSLFSASQPPRTMPGSPSYPRPGPSTIQQRHPLSPFNDNKITQPQPLSRPEPTSNAPFSHASFQPAYSYPPSTPVTASYQQPLFEQPTWRNGNLEQERAEEVRKAVPKESPPDKCVYGECVKRHLDIFDLEMALNEVGLMTML